MKRVGLGLISLAVISLIFALPIQPAAAAEAKTILIGFTASQTGKLNVEAIRQINGLNLWVEQVNKAGGIKLPDGTMVKVQTKFYDDESNKDRVQELYTRLISSDKADFLISPYSSPLSASTCTTPWTGTPGHRRRWSAHGARTVPSWCRSVTARATGAT